MRKLGFKRRFILISSVSMALFVIIFGCIFAVVANFIENNNKTTFVVPDGAPALSIAKLLSEDTKDDGIEYTIVSPTGIESYVTSSHKSKNADLCVLPLTDAALLLGDGANYRALGVVTHGNFFFISEKECFFDEENLAELVGKKIGFVQLGKLPGLVFRSVLQAHGIPFKVCQDLQSCVEDAVNLINIRAEFVTKGAGYDMFAMPEPAVTTKIEKAGFFLVGNLQSLYGDGGYAQAVLVAKKTFLAENGAMVEELLRKLRENRGWLSVKDGKEVLAAIERRLKKGLTSTWTSANLTSDCAERCGVYFRDAREMKNEINALIEHLRAVDPNAVATFSDAFFE